MGLVAELINDSRVPGVCVVGGRVKKLYPALKHGGYSATGLLPGEDPVAFEKLHQDLRLEYCPDGPLQEDTVRDIARWTWRKASAREKGRRVLGYSEPKTDNHAAFLGPDRRGKVEKSWNVSLIGPERCCGRWRGGSAHECLQQTPNPESTSSSRRSAGTEDAGQALVGGSICTLWLYSCKLETET
jgi:hypothetical protein